MIDRWDALAIAGLLAVMAGLLNINPWLLLVMWGVIMVAVGLVKGR